MEIHIYPVSNILARYNQKRFYFSFGVPKNFLNYFVKFRDLKSKIFPKAEKILGVILKIFVLYLNLFQIQNFPKAGKSLTYLTRKNKLQNNKKNFFGTPKIFSVLLK